MKKFYLITSIFLNSSIFAEIPSKMAFIDIIKSIPNIGKKQETHCKEKLIEFNQKRQREGFSGTINCQVQCRRKNPEIISDVNTFTNEAMNLRNGDGGFHASFNINLDLWLDSICLQMAKKHCGKNKIQSVNLLNLQSGTWNYSGPEYCPSKDEAKKINHDENNLKIVLPNFTPKIHPFEKISGSQLSIAPTNYLLENLALPNPGYNIRRENIKVDEEYLFDTYTFGEFLNAHPDLFTNHDNMDSIQKYVFKETGNKNMDEFKQWILKRNPVNVRSCKRPINIQTCYGDCISVDESANAMMASMVIGEVNVNQKEVCLDELFIFVKKNKIKKSLFPNYCRMFFNQTFAQGDFTGTSCSSFRFRDPCQDLANNL